MVDYYFLADAKNLKWCFCCPHEENASQIHCDSRYILQRLTMMLADNDSRFLINRHILLINHFLGLTDNKFRIVDVPYIPAILEYLCKEFTNGETLYNKPLQSLLNLIQTPPMVNCSSQNIQYQQDVSNYFNSLGNCYSIVTDHNKRFMIISALNNTLCLRKEHESWVNQATCIEALEESQMISKFAETLKTVQDKRDLSNIVDLMNNVTILSEKCCVLLYYNNFVEEVLNLIPLFLHDPDYHNDLDRSGFLILKIIATTISSTVNNIKPLQYTSQIMRILRDWLQKEALSGFRNKRNLIVTIILAMVTCTDEQNDLSSPEFLEDIILLSIAPDSSKENSWTKNVVLRSETVDFEFKHLLLVILHELIGNKRTKMICKKSEAVEGLSQLFDFKIWTEDQNQIILKDCLNLVPCLAKCLYEEVIKYDLISIMFNTSGKIIHKSDCDENFIYFIQSLHSLTLNDNLTEYFEEKNIIPFLIEYCELILGMSSWSIRVQLVLEYTLCSIVNISHKIDKSCSKCITKGLASNISRDILKRYNKPNQQDFKFDPGLIVSILDFIWKETIKDEDGKKEFIKQGGVYLTLDALEKVCQKSTIGGTSIMVLSLLVELIDDELAISQFITWKGITYSHIMSMLCSIWRMAEKEKCVTRDQNCIEDIEAPLMGIKQFEIKFEPGSCPPILDMIGCHRPKIYSIMSNLLKHHVQIVKVAEENYKALFRNLTTEDKITMEIIRNYEYFKEGEIWKNILNCLKKGGIPPIAGDEMLLHTLILKHIMSTKQIQLKQKSFIKKQLKKELEEEKKLYNKIKQNRIVEEIDRCQEIKKELAIKNTQMGLLMNQKKVNKENNVLHQWRKFGYHRTYDLDISKPTSNIARDLITTGKVTDIKNI